MIPTLEQRSDQAATLRHAALVAGFSLLITIIASPFAEFFVYRRLVVVGDVQLSVQNVLASNGLFLTGLFAYLITFICDLLISWALYVLLAPVNRSLSLLTAWFRLMYTAVALTGLAKLFTAFRILNTPDYATAFGPAQMHAQVYLLLRSFRYDWYVGFVFFAIHLVLLGFLVYRSGYIPRIFGALLVINGLGYLIDCLKPYLYPGANIGFIMVLFFGEVVFMLWLLAKGWRIPADSVSVGERSAVA